MQTGEEPIVGEAPRKAGELKSHAIDSLQGLKETRSDKEASLTQTDKVNNINTWNTNFQNTYALSR